MIRKGIGDVALESDGEKCRVDEFEEIVCVCVFCSADIGVGSVTTEA